MAIFVISAYFPIPSSEGLASPLAYFGSDLHFYSKSAELLFDRPLSKTIADVVAFLETGDHKSVEYILVGPLIPYLLHAFGHAPGNTLPLATLYLLMAALMILPWLEYLRRLQVGCFWLLCFALWPLPIIYMLGISTDMPFALAVAWFFFAYFVLPQRRSVVVLWLVALTVMVLSRPNANPLIAFVFVDQLYGLVRYGRRDGLIVLLFVGLLGLIGAALHIPPLFDLPTAFRVTVFFDLPTETYVQGLFPDLPAFLDKALSFAALGIAKTLYLLGLRPSYGDTAIFLVILRGLPGLVMLVGLFGMIFRADRRLQIFMLLFLLPIFAGATQERYTMPVMPVLFGYGVIVLNDGIAWLTRSLGVMRQDRSNAADSRNEMVFGRPSYSAPSDEKPTAHREK